MSRRGSWAAEEAAQSDSNRAQRQRRRAGIARSARQVVEQLERRVLLSVATFVEARSLVDVPRLQLDAPRSPLAPASASGILHGQTSAAVDGVVFSDLGQGSGYAAFEVDTGVLGWDDYNSINNEDIFLTEMSFIGGVNMAGGQISFEFYDSDGYFVDAVTYAFQDAGNYIWELTMPEGIVIPDQGYVQLVAEAGTYGQWFLSDAAPTVGSENAAEGGAVGGYSHNFELVNSATGTPAADTDLAPAYYSSWSDTIVVSTVQGTTSDAEKIPVGSTIYVDAMVGNFGDDAAGAFNADLWLDGALVGSYPVSGLASWTGYEFMDVNLGAVSAGWHTVTFVVDTADVIDEYDENNNLYSRTFYVADNYDGQVAGIRFNDINHDGVRDAGEPGLAGWTIYADLNDNGVLDTATEPFDITDSSGEYSLTLDAGTYNLREVPQANWIQTSPGPGGKSNNNFEITVNFIDSSLTPSQQAVFMQAADRWAEVIVGDLPDLYLAGLFVDDVVINASAVAIDGVSGILGQAGPRVLRGTSFLPGTGVMQFDSADLANMEQGGTLTDVILHEMGHVLGIGTIWDFLGLLQGAGGTDPRFTGASAALEYNQIFGTTGGSVPVENQGGSGTRDSHWRETIFDNELMTGWINGSTHPLSRVTAASLEDIGYVVDMGAADGFVAPGSADVREGSSLNGYFVSPAGGPKVMAQPAIRMQQWSMLAGAMAPSSYEVHVNPGQTVAGIDFGGYLENPGPTDISLSGSSVAEALPANTLVGAFSSTDPTAGDSFTYALVAGAGDGDNGRFSITGNELRTSAPLDFESGSTLSIRVRSTDQTALAWEKAFTITVSDVNESPTGLSISAAAIAENLAAGFAVGQLSALDQDAGNSISYSLVSGEGATDNASFAISGQELRSTAVFDYETKSSYSIRVRAADQGGLWTESAFTIAVTDANDAPTGLTLSSATFAENQPIGSGVGTFSPLDQDASDTFGYELVSGEGSTDNSFFAISDNLLRTAGMFDFETRTSYSIRVRVTDHSGLSFEQPFAIAVVNGNDTPTDLTISSKEIAENLPAGSGVATLGVADVDGGVVTYSLVAGSGDSDNAAFTVSGDQLLSAAAFDYETKGSYAIRLRVTDDGGLFCEKSVVITVVDASDAPTGFTLSPASIAENLPTGSTVGSFAGEDQDAGSTHTFLLVAGEGDADNAMFQITGNTLNAKSSFNYETKPSYSIRVRVTDDSGLSYEKPLTIAVTDVVEIRTPWIIDGTAAGDTVSLALVGNNYRLIMNGETSYRIADTVSSITVNLLGGDDSTTVGGSMPSVAINGDDGNDTLRGGNGADTISGGAGNDSIVGMDGADSISGDAGNDTVYAGVGADSIHLGDGNDVARSGRDNDSIWGDAGRDIIVGDNHHDLIYGGSENDTINGGSGNDTIYGEAGMDRLVGVGGNDLLNGGADRDGLMGGYDNDSLIGEAGDDTIKGGLGNDTLEGGLGADTMLGEGGDDWLYSGGDDVRDFVRGDAGSDHVRRDALDRLLDTIEDSVLV